MLDYGGVLVVPMKFSLRTKCYHVMCSQFRCGAKEFVYTVLGISAVSPAAWGRGCSGCYYRTAGHKAEPDKDAVYSRETFGTG